MGYKLYSHKTNYTRELFLRLYSLIDKYMGRKNRKKRVKKIIPKKNRDERERDINKIKIQLSMVNMGTEIPGIKKAFEVFDKYIEDGLYVDGKIKLEGYKRLLRYRLFEKAGLECATMLEFNPDI